MNSNIENKGIIYFWTLERMVYSNHDLDQDDQEGQECPPSGIFKDV